MESKVNEKKLSSNVIDLIDLSEKTKLDEYLLYLRCYKCNTVMLEPKTCMTCNLTVCPNCKVCTHALVQSRHIKSLLEKLTFKCLFNSQGCKAIPKYLDVRAHLVNCQFFDEKLLASSKDSKTNSNNNIMSFTKQNQSQSNDNVLMMSSDLLFSSTKITDYE
jgi:hypothetical protein